jgi:hypothetical protein
MKMILAALAVCVATSALAKTQEVQDKCGVDAMRNCTAQKLEVLQRGNGQYAGTVGGVIALRRLEENFYLLFVDYMDTPPLGLGAMFHKCLEDEAAEGK